MLAVRVLVCAVARNGERAAVNAVLRLPQFRVFCQIACKKCLIDRSSPLSVMFLKC